MSIKVVKNLVSSSKYSIKCPYTITPQYITFHNTANSASAESEVKYMISNNNQVSFHYAVDDKEVVQGVPTNRNAWHCGDGKGNGNMKSIGVEVCYSKSGGDKYKKAEALAIKFIAQLLHERGWGVDRVRTHKSWTEIGVKTGYSTYVKNCPHRVLDEGRWNAVLKAIQKELDSLNGKKVTQVSKPSTSASTTSKVTGTVKILASTLNYYNSPRWTKPTGTVKKNEVFTVVGKVKVDGAYQYKLKAGNYITASSKYVKFTAK